MSATIKDDRPSRLALPWLVIGTDSLLSGWGGASGGLSYAAWAFASEGEACEAELRLRRRSDMKRVRVVFDGGRRPYRPGRQCAHLHVYIGTGGYAD